MKLLMLLVRDWWHKCMKPAVWFYNPPHCSVLYLCSPEMPCHPFRRDVTSSLWSAITSISPKSSLVLQTRRQHLKNWLLHNTLFLYYGLFAVQVFFLPQQRLIPSTKLNQSTQYFLTRPQPQPPTKLRQDLWYTPSWVGHIWSTFSLPCCTNSTQGE